MSTQQPYHLESNKIISDLVRILTTIVIVDSDSKLNAVKALCYLRPALGERTQQLIAALFHLRRQIDLRPF